MIVPPSIGLPPLPRADAIVDPRVGDAGPALLALEDGTVFPGIAFGAPVASGGDLVVNTSQTGYQEIATDPSYAGQVVVMTYPLIGNYGRLEDEDQSERPWLRGLIVANATAAVLDDARQLATLLRTNGIPAIAGVDTRALARHLRATGCLRGVITVPGLNDPGAAVAMAREVPRWEDQDFVAQVSPTAVRETAATRRRPWSRSWTSGSRPTSCARCAVAACASASCRTRPRRRRSCAGRVGRRPRPGPGDPARLHGPVALARAIIDDGRPLLGICLGHQIVGRAAGAETSRLRFGTTARTTRSRTWTRAMSRSPRRTTRSGWSPRRCPRHPASGSASST